MGGAWHLVVGQLGRAWDGAWVGAWGGGGGNAGVVMCQNPNLTPPNL